MRNKILILLIFIFALHNKMYAAAEVDFGLDTSIFVDHDENNSYSFAELNTITCDAPVSVDKVLVQQDSLELSRFSITPILSDNAASFSVRLILYAGYDAYDLHRIETVKYEEGLVIDFVWYEYFKTDLMKLDKIHFLIVPEVKVEDFSSPKMYSFPIQVTIHDCDADSPKVPNLTSSAFSGTYLMKLSDQDINTSVQKEGIICLFSRMSPYVNNDSEDVFSGAYVFYWYNAAAQSWSYEIISSKLYRLDGTLFNKTPFTGTFVKAGTVWSSLFSFAYSPQFVLPYTSGMDFKSIPDLYFGDNLTAKYTYGLGFYCAFPMNNGVMSSGGIGGSVGNSDDLPHDSDDIEYDASTGDFTDVSKGPLDFILDFLVGTSELEKTSAIAFRKVPFSFFSYMSSISGVFVNENFTADKLYFDVPIYMWKNTVKMKFNVDIFKTGGGTGTLIRNLVLNFFRLLIYFSTGFFLFGILQKTANFLTN